MSKPTENWKKYKNNKDVNEEFCGACLAIPVALTGLGVGTYGSTSKKHKNSKKMAFWGFLIGGIALIITLIFYFRCSTCH
jgi:uncharacterized membrane protein YjfL (UPF0719 family)